MNMNDIDLSIIIPVYNEEDIIENTVIEVECALRPLDYAYEIILVDDGSKDDTWKTIERIEKMKRGGFLREYYFPVILEKRLRYWQDWLIRREEQ